jgi:hypothetical protein
MSYGIYRNAGLIAFASLAMLAVWGIHVGAQERSGREIRRELRNESRQAVGAAGAAASHSGHGGAANDCAAACADCQRSCDSCAEHCLKLVAEGNKRHQQTLQTCLDCAEICAAADRIVSRSGPFSDTICRACAEACKRCATACEQFPDDEHMAQCANECGKCQRACESMLSQSPQAGRTNPTESKNR